MNTKETVKPSKNLKMAAGLVASAAAATIAAMAYKVNEEKINEGIDKAADVTKNVIGKVSEKVKEAADDLMNIVDGAAAEDVVADVEPATEVAEEVPTVEDTSVPEEESPAEGDA